MEKKTLIEIKNKLIKLPLLQDRLEKLQDEISEAENNVQLLLDKYEKETLDVENLKKDSLSVTILKFVGKYEGKVTKETEEMLTAKLEYDRAIGRVNELNNEKDSLTNRIAKLSKERELYEKELKRREELIKNKSANAVSEKYLKLEAEQNLLTRQIVETDEAIKAAKKVIDTANCTIKNLDSAEEWATYDAWTRGGIFSYLAKYDHIDEAQENANRLQSQIKDLQKELKDIDNIGDVSFYGIDSTTRAMDLWFDNIFTDMAVRDRIRDDNKRLRNLRDEIDKIVVSLEKSKAQLSQEILDIEDKKNELIILS
jgi:chromosome segregation ATPase